MTKEQLIAKLESIRLEHGTELGHVFADEALLEYINDEDISKAYDAVPKWYS